jgi:hypothetical protein
MVPPLHQLLPQESWPSDWFYIVSALDTEQGEKRVLDVKFSSRQAKADIWLFTPNGTAAQMWRWDGEGRLESKLGHTLDVEGANTEPGARVWMYPKNPTAAQKWKYRPDTQELVSELSSLVLGVVGAQRSIEAPVHVWTATGTVAQRWTLEPHPGPAAAANSDSGSDDDDAGAAAPPPPPAAAPPPPPAAAPAAPAPPPGTKPATGPFGGFGSDVAGW